MAVLDHKSDVLVHEFNFVDPVMRKSIPAAWRRMRGSARALAHERLTNDPDSDDVDQLLEQAVARLVRGGDDDVVSFEDLLATLIGRLREVLPYAVQILGFRESGRVRVEGVRGDLGKALHAEPTSQAYETGHPSHAGVFPAPEQELLT